MPNELPAWLTSPKTLKAIAESEGYDFNRPDVHEVYNAINTPVNEQGGEAAMIALTDLLKQLGGTRPDMMAACISELIFQLNGHLSGDL